MNGGRAKLSCIEVPALPDGPWGVTFAQGRARGGPFQRGFDCAMLARLHNLRHGLGYCIPTCPEMSSSVGRKIEWLSDLAHVGGAVKVSWAEMEASQDSLVAPTCGNGRAAKVRVQLGQAEKLGKESESSSESSESDSSTVRWASSHSSGDGVFAVLYTLDTL